MTSPLCKCGCGREITQGQWGSEGDEAFAERLATGYARRKCARLDKPSPSPKDRPALVADSAGWNYQRPEGKEQPKELTPRDPAYLDWLRTFDCVECGWPAHMGNIEAHHVRTGGMAIKGSDYESAPLCSANARGCHAAADKTPASVEKYLPWALRFNALWIAAGNKIKKGGR
jgi:hypothetical protein